MTLPFIITIDGPAGVGKSTLAQKLAAQLLVAYLDTGAMFRTIALRLAAFAPEGRQVQVSPDFLVELKGITFSLYGSGSESTLLCNGVPVGQEIRTEEAAMLAARFAVVPEVRAQLKAEQQKLAGDYSFVAEGRDMGTEVFPQAQCKIFLDARPEVRAMRRFNQMKSMGQNADLHDLTLQIEERDRQDRNRAIAPLRPAQDARLVDTSDKNLDEVFSELLRIVSECGGLSTFVTG